MDDAGPFNPFPGLRSFEPEEDYLFFGRDAEIDELLRRLRVQRFLAVLGTSGSGKSSLVRSGLIPSLYSGLMTRAGSSWRVAVMRPGEDPIGHLAAALDGCLHNPEAAVDAELAALERAFLESTLRASDVGLTAAVRQARLPSHDNLLVVVDQFEELFRFKDSRAGAGNQALAFVNLLLEAARKDEAPVYVTLTMRSDFIGHSMEFPGLPEAINQGLYLIPRMTRAELRAAITGPVAVGGGEISSGLVLGLINDVGDDPDQLPVLQHALMRTWDYWQAHREDGEPLDLAHYRAVGTMREALSLHAEEAYGELEGEGERRIAETLFKALTDDTSGVRRPCRMEEICALAEAEPEAVIAVVERFRRPGRSFLMPPAGVELEAGSILDISHESLMRLWERLVAWSEDEARSAQFYRRLSRAAARHQEGTAGLWRSPELDLAETWRHEQRPTASWAVRYDPHFERAMAFLDESQRTRDAWLASQERKRRIRQWAVSALAVIFALVAAVMALQARRIGEEAERANREAETAEQVSEFMVDLFRVSDPSEARGNTVTAREILDRGAEKIAEELADQPLTQARLMETMGKVYSSLGLYGQAAPLFEEALESRQELLGDQHVDVARSRQQLATLYKAQARYAEAEPVYLSALATLERELGAGHADVAECLTDLGFLYRLQGRYEEAESVYQRALAILEAALGSDHPRMADSLNGLASVYANQGRLAEARPLFQRVLAIDEQALGPDHPGIARTLNNLGNVYWMEGDQEKSEEVYLRALAIREKSLAPDHPDLAVSLEQLALSYTEQGRYRKAEPYFRRALEAYEKALGAEHPQLANLRVGFAESLQGQGELDKAEPLHRSSLQILERALGPEHPRVAYPLLGLAKIYRERQRFAEAEALYQRALAVREKALGPDHSLVKGTLNDYAALLRAMGRDREAEESEARAGAASEEPGTDG